MSKDKFPLYEIQWVDAMSVGVEFAQIKDARKVSSIPAKTAGYLIKKDNDAIVLCMTYFHETEASEESFKFLWAIPRGCIKSIRKL